MNVSLSRYFAAGHRMISVLSRPEFQHIRRLLRFTGTHTLTSGASKNIQRSLIWQFPLKSCPHAENIQSTVSTQARCQTVELFRATCCAISSRWKRFLWECFPVTSERESFGFQSNPQLLERVFHLLFLLTAPIRGCKVTPDLAVTRLNLTTAALLLLYWDISTCHTVVKKCSHYLCMTKFCLAALSNQVS